LDDRIKSGSACRAAPGDDECLVCLAKLSQTGTFAHLLWEGERARFCSQDCFEIFQNNPNSFMGRLKARARGGKSAAPEIAVERDARRPRYEGTTSLD
jgi:hypothetical protein